MTEYTRLAQRVADLEASVQRLEGALSAQPSDRAEGEIVASRLVIRNSAGRDRIVIEVNESPEGERENGRMLMFTVTGERSIKIEVPDNPKSGPSLVMFGAGEDLAVVLQQKGSRGPFLHLIHNTVEQYKDIYLGIHHDDDAENVRIYMNRKLKGQSSSRDEQALLEIGATTEGLSSRLELTDKDGRTAVVAP